MDRSARRAGLRSDAGLTLIETLISIIILSIAGVAILTGLQLSEKASDIHRKQSTGGAYVRSYAEAIERYLDTNSNYVACAKSTDYTNAQLTTDNGFSVPFGYSATHSDAIPVAGAGGEGSCPGGDTGVQKLKLTVSSNDGRATEHLTIIVRKACGTGSSCS